MTEEPSPAAPTPPLRRAASRTTRTSARTAPGARHVRPRRSPAAGADGVGLVSFIVPCSGAAPYLGECLGSLLAQTYAGRMEVCVWDDGSADGSAAVVDAWQRASGGRPNRCALAAASAAARARAARARRGRARARARRAALPAGRRRRGAPGRVAALVAAARAAGLIAAAPRARTAARPRDGRRARAARLAVRARARGRDAALRGVVRRDRGRAAAARGLRGAIAQPTWFLRDCFGARAATSPRPVARRRRPDKAMTRPRATPTPTARRCAARTSTSLPPASRRPRRRPAPAASRRAAATTATANPERAAQVELPLVRYRHHGGSQSERTPRRELLPCARAFGAACSRRARWSPASAIDAGRDRRAFANELCALDARYAAGPRGSRRCATSTRQAVASTWARRTAAAVVPSAANPPVVCCVALGRTDGAFEAGMHLGCRAGLARARLLAAEGPSKWCRAQYGNRACSSDRISYAPRRRLRRRRRAGRDVEFAANGTRRARVRR